MTTTTRVSSCDACGGQIAHDERIIVHSECSVDPLRVCPECALDYVECDGCHKRVDRNFASSRHDDGGAPWLCIRCVRACDECYKIIVIDGVIAVNNGEPPWFCDGCVRYCDECGDRIDDHDNSTARDSNGEAPWLCSECARPCDECRRVVFIDDEHIFDEAEHWLCDECLQCDECGDRISPEDRLSRYGHRHAPWLCRECGVECNRCSRTLLRDSEYAGENDTWLCDDCGVPCDACGVLVGRAHDVPREAYRISNSPWFCDECGEECDECGEEFLRSDDSIGLCPSCYAAESDVESPAGSA